MQDTLIWTFFPTHDRVLSSISRSSLPAGVFSLSFHPPTRRRLLLNVTSATCAILDDYPLPPLAPFFPTRRPTISSLHMSHRSVKPIRPPEPLVSPGEHPQSKPARLWTRGSFLHSLPRRLRGDQDCSVRSVKPSRSGLYSPRLANSSYKTCASLSFFRGRCQPPVPSH